MEEEARTLLPALLHLYPQGTKAVQEYVDAVCGRMHESHSPGHHIVVLRGATVIQSASHGRSSGELLAAMQTAADSPDQQADYQQERLAVGTARQDDVTVHVSEYLTHLRQSVRRHVLWRIGEIVLLGLVTAAVTCPSCHQKRALLTAIHVAEEVCSPVAHRQVVLTIPKRLRLHTRFDRKLLGKLCSSACTCLKAEIQRLLGRDDVLPGMIAAIQTHGELLHWHPHIHALVTCGGFTPEGDFLGVILIL